MSRLSIKQLTLLPALLLALSTLISAQEYNFNFNTDDFAARNPCKPFIGVGTSKASEGLKVDYTVDNTPATTYDVRTGDVILTLDGTPVRSQSELLRERDKHQAGDAFTLTILREGVQKTIQARFKPCSAEELEEAKEQMEIALAEKMLHLESLQAKISENFKGFEMQERPILGVFENTEVNANGLVIESVIPGKGAAAAGLQEGDVVINVDGKTVTGSSTLRNALNNHKAGERVSVTYLRDGKTIQTEATLSSDRYSFTHEVKRDPCKVFIGVYTSNNAVNGRGARVDGVIDDTPAKISDVQPGDVILAFNGQPVNNHQELTRERDKGKPGEAFQMTVLRNGVTMEINARFKSCDKAQETSNKETVTTLQEEMAAEQREAPTMDNALKLEVFEAYPSPTYGTVNLKFEAEAVPTTVRILDISGKTVYFKDLPKFDGSFTDQVNLSNQKAGNYVLSIQQGDKVQSKQIVLLPRA